MSDDQEQQPTEEQQQPAALAEQQPAQSAPLQEVQHVRLGGQAGVRVTQQLGMPSATRPSGVRDPAPDCKLVPLEVLAAARELLDGRPQLPAADCVQAVRDLLAPWL
jgi:hypothetical protein